MLAFGEGGWKYGCRSADLAIGCQAIPVSETVRKVGGGHTRCAPEIRRSGSICSMLLRRCRPRSSISGKSFRKSAGCHFGNDCLLSGICARPGQVWTVGVPMRLFFDSQVPRSAHWHLSVKHRAEMGGAPEDFEDLVDLRITRHEWQSRRHLGKDGCARPDIDLYVASHDRMSARTAHRPKVARTHGCSVVTSSEQNLERTVPQCDDLQREAIRRQRTGCGVSSRFSWRTSWVYVRKGTPYVRARPKSAIWG